MNSIFLLEPYKINGVWAFDDPARGLIREPFVARMNDYIDTLAVGIEHAKTGIRLLFSAEPFPGYRLRFYRKRAEFGGTWYGCGAPEGEGWLCSALFKHFDTAPLFIYAKAEALPT